MKKAFTFLMAVVFIFSLARTAEATNNCIICFGRGFVTCITCHGLGTLSSFGLDHGYGTSTTCPPCMGAGQVRCPACGGSGQGPDTSSKGGGANTVTGGGNGSGGFAVRSASINAGDSIDITAPMTGSSYTWVVKNDSDAVGILNSTSQTCTVTGNKAGTATIICNVWVNGQRYYDEFTVKVSGAAPTATPASAPSPTSAPSATSTPSATNAPSSTSTPTSTPSPVSTKAPDTKAGKRSGDFEIRDDGMLLRYYGTDEILRIPENVTTIGENVLLKINRISENNIQYIDNDSKTNPKNVVKRINIPPNVEIIWYNAFSESTQLKEVYMEPGVKYIHQWAFANSPLMESIRIPSTVTRIDAGAFSGCTSLEHIIIPPSVKNFQLSRANGSDRDYYKQASYDIFTGCHPNLTIYGEKGSAAETYAKDKKINFIAVQFNDKDYYPGTLIKTATAVTGTPLWYKAIGDTYMYKHNAAFFKDYQKYLLNNGYSLIDTSKSPNGDTVTIREKYQKGGGFVELTESSATMYVGFGFLSTASAAPAAAPKPTAAPTPTSTPALGFSLIPVVTPKPTATPAPAAEKSDYYPDTKIKTPTAVTGVESYMQVGRGEYYKDSGSACEQYQKYLTSIGFTISNSKELSANGLFYTYKKDNVIILVTKYPEKFDVTFAKIED